MAMVKTFDQELLAGIPAGMWVAISQDQEKVVGQGLMIEEALKQARENGQPKPYILRVPKGHASLIL